MQIFYKTKILCSESPENGGRIGGSILIRNFDDSSTQIHNISGRTM